MHACAWQGRPGRGRAATGSPTAIDDQLTNAVSSRAVHAANASRLELRWRARLDGQVFASPLVATVTTEIWRTRTGDGNQAPPLVVNGIVFAGGGTSGLYALSGKTGQVLWSYDTGGEATLSPLVEAADTILAPVGSSLEAFAPAPPT